ncbi:ABC transporter ATP-binding protein [Floccifex sp.]|uniref:ABC transporter ATP-binding protein n=1 Tax=Floccifex sp. TaxID=2815810 RepID=UPI003F113A34
MWKYIKRYLPYSIIAALFMISEVCVDLIQPSIMASIVDDGVLKGNMDWVWKLGFIMICVVLFGGLCGSMNNVFVHISGQNIGNDIRKDAFKRIMNLSFQQVDQYTTGSLVTRMTNDITQVQNFVSLFVRGMIRTTLLLAGSIFFMYRINIIFGQIVTLAFPFIVGTLLYCLWKANPLFLQLQSQLDSINSILQEDILGIRIIKACVKEIYEKIRFSKANDNLIHTQLHVLLIFAFMNPIIDALIYIVIALILKAGAIQILSIGQIMAGITYTTQLLNGIMSLTILLQNISRGYVSWKRVKELLCQEPQIEDGTQKNLKQEGEIEFQNVSFSYTKNSHKILKNINLKIKPGQSVAILGATGCGKSTLVHLICRFYDVDEGRILIDGIDVRSYKQKELRDKIAIVLQKNELFNTTIQENIAWGNEKTSLEEIQEAASIAQAHFISDYQQMVQERGMSLSGGQRQRICIARAIVKKAEILILDDATSALDLKTEKDLLDALSSFHQTKIIVTQRIASAMRADFIVVLKKGRIESIGKHEDLLKNSKTYVDIFQSQCKEEDYGQ